MMSSFKGERCTNFRIGHYYIAITGPNNSLDITISIILITYSQGYFNFIPPRWFEPAMEVCTSNVLRISYADVKYIQEACGTAYFAILKAIEERLQCKGVSKKELPKSVDGYREALRRYLGIHNGKLLREFESLYEELHIAGYYRGLLRHVDVIKDVFKSAKVFIDKIGKH